MPGISPTKFVRPGEAGESLVKLAGRPSGHIDADSRGPVQAEKNATSSTPETGPYTMSAASDQARAGD